MDQENFIKWYASKRQIYSELTNAARSKIEEILLKKAVQYCEKTDRTKSIGNFKNKIIRKHITNPDKIVDLSGIRVIGYFDEESQKLIRENPTI